MTVVQWIIVVCDLDQTEFFTIGPFKNKDEADEFENDLWQCEVLTSVHPWIESMKWIGRARPSSLRFAEHEPSRIELATLRELLRA